MKTGAKILIFFFFLFFFNVQAFAMELQIKSQLQTDEVLTLENSIINAGGKLDDSLADSALKVLRGELGVTPTAIIKNGSKILFSEISEVFTFLSRLVAVALIAAIFTALSSSFDKKGASELGFYVTYIVAASILLSSFSSCVFVLTDFISSVREIAQAAAPVAVTVSVLAGSGAKAYSSAALIYSASAFIDNIFSSLIVPLIFGGAVLKIVNCLSEKDLVDKLADLIKKGAVWAIGLTCSAFTAVSALQGITAPTINTLSSKAAKFAAGAVPVVGGALSGAVDTALYMGQAIKSGILSVLAIALISVCLAPVLKLAAFAISFKLISALISPICEDRISDAIDGIAAFAFTLVAIAAFVAFMFIYLCLSALS